MKTLALDFLNKNIRNLIKNLVMKDCVSIFGRSVKKCIIDGGFLAILISLIPLFSIKSYAIKKSSLSDHQVTNNFQDEKFAVPGEYIVKLKTQSSLFFMDQDFTQRRLGSFLKSRLPSAQSIVVKRASFESQKSVINELSKDPMVEYVEPNILYHSLIAPNDPSYNQQWGLNNIISGKNAVDIEIEKAWNLQTGSSEVIVAIVDSGIQYHHPDLENNIWKNEKEANGKPGVDDDGNGYVDDIYGINPVRDGELSVPLDNNGHGTHCSGTIGSSGNNGIGITGVNWNVKLMGLKFLKSDGVGTLEAAVEAIDYAVKMGAKVINNSWGSYETSVALNEAIDRANKAGVVFVVAAGNDGTNNDEKPMYPASYPAPNVISVAAVGHNGDIANFSNWGPKTVHLGAPGVGVFGFWLGNSTRAPSGTSTAAPFVSGVAALIYAQNPGISNLEVKERILKSVKTLPSLRGRTITSGLLNAFYSVSNQAPPLNPDDPENWNSIPLSIDTDHPYLPNTQKRFEVHIPGANEISIYFSNLDTEFQMDEVKIKDKTGKIAHNLSGARGAFYSHFVKGDTAFIEFKSDHLKEGYGFSVTKAYYR